MEKVIQSRICTAFILSIRPILKFSRHRLENLLDYCLGRIMQHYYRLKMRQLVIGMRKKPQNRLGVSVLCRGTFLLSIITVCSRTQKKEPVESEMKELTAPYQNDKLEFIKNPVVAEFLGFSQNTDFTESDLEKSILSNLQKFLMELGKGYAFVARQQHIHTEKQDYYIDLVFYNYILKCFVLIDLKTEKITHQDVGQMDMYIRMYDELKRSEGDNPTIGIVLCSDTDDDIARYSVMHGNEQLFASKYKLYLPTKEELKAEIETQKAMFYLQQQDNEEKKIE